MKGIEKELKLSLTENEYKKVLSLANCGFDVQINHYFQTSMPATMLRVREKNGEYVLCYKQRVENDDCIAVSNEYEVPLTSGQTQAFLQGGISAKDLCELLHVQTSEKQMRYVGSLTTERTTFWVRDWHLELDKNTYLGITDYELECENDNSESLEELKNFLANELCIGIVPSLPKSQRFVNALSQNNNKGKI